jgi:hypothetical protein
VGLDKLEAGLRLVGESVAPAPGFSLPGELERRAREGLALLRSAVDWLEDTEHFDNAHRAIDHAGREVRSRFGCHLTFERAKGYSQTCPVALAHSRVGMSAGFIVEEAECSICELDPEDCDHITGQRYGDEVCVRVITKASLLEVSLVSRPNQPDARVHSISLARTELESELGPSFRYGMPVSCDRCLGECVGMTELPSAHA